MSSTKITDFIDGVTDLTPLIDDRYFFMVPEKSAQEPYLIYQLVNDEPVRDLSGLSPLVMQQWELIIVAKTYINIELIKTALVEAFSTETALFTAGFLGQLDEIDQESNHYTTTLTFSIHYQR